MEIVKKCAMFTNVEKLIIINKLFVKVVKMEKENRLLWIDGLKGFSCVFILIHHYFLGKFPASYFGSERESLLNGVDTYLSQSVFSFFMTGNFFVHLYVLITGYVVALQIKKTNACPDNFFPFSIKRYLKLFFPLFIYCFLVWLLSLLPDAQPDENVNLLNVFKASIVKILVLGNQDFGGHFWMLNYTFLGGLAVSLAGAYSWHLPNFKMLFIFSAIIIIALIHKTMGAFLYATCFAGAFLYFFIDYFQTVELKHRQLLFTILFLISIFFGAYPTGVTPSNYYRFFKLPVASGLSPFFWHFLSAFLFFLSVSQIKSLRLFFELSFNQKLAKYSYLFYIVHGLCIHWSDLLSRKFEQITSMNYVGVCFIFLPVSILLSLGLAILLQKVLIGPYNKRVNSFVLRCFKREKT